MTHSAQLRRTCTARASLSAIVALLISLAGCGSDSASDFSPGRSSEKLQSLTMELVGTQLDSDASLAVAFDRATAAVLDLSTTSAPEYGSRHGRSPHDNASLLGQWLGLLRREHRDARSTQALRDSATKAIAASGVVPSIQRDDTASDILGSVLAALSGAIPNEDSDNSRITNAGTLRSAFQAAASFD